MPRVSVVVTTRNEERNLGRCLASVQRQTFKDFELIVVDNNSTDRTKDIAQEYTDQVYNLGPERSAQRNYGIEMGSGRYVLFLDADMALSESVISECVAKLDQDSAIVALYIPEHIVGEGFWIKVRNFERKFYDRTVVDCVRFIRRSVFEAIGGFDLNLCGPEDWDLDRRINAKGKTTSIVSPIYHDEGQFQLDDYTGKKSYYAQSFDRYISKWGHRDKIVRKQLGAFYRFFGVYVEDGKFVRLLCHPLLTLGMYYLRFRVGLSYLKAKRLGASQAG